MKTLRHCRVVPFYWRYLTWAPGLINRAVACRFSPPQIYRVALLRVESYFTWYYRSSINHGLGSVREPGREPAGRTTAPPPNLLHFLWIFPSVLCVCVFFFANSSTLEFFLGCANPARHSSPPPSPSTFSLPLSPALSWIGFVSYDFHRAIDYFYFLLF